MVHVWDHFDFTNDVAWWTEQGYPLVKVLVLLIAFVDNCSGLYHRALHRSISISLFLMNGSKTVVLSLRLAILQSRLRLLLAALMHSS